MDKKAKIKVIHEQIDSSRRFQQEYGANLSIIKLALNFMPDDLIDQLYGFLILEQNEKKS